MNSGIKEILENEDFTRENIISLLRSEDEDKTLLFTRSASVRDHHIGNKVWFRGLIEFSNICSKDCLCCGIRKGNKNINSYNYKCTLNPWSENSQESLIILESQLDGVKNIHFSAENILYLHK